MKRTQTLLSLWVCTWVFIYSILFFVHLCISFKQIACRLLLPSGFLFSPLANLRVFSLEHTWTHQFLHVPFLRFYTEHRLHYFFKTPRTHGHFLDFAFTFGKSLHNKTTLDANHSLQFNHKMKLSVDVVLLSSCSLTNQQNKQYFDIFKCFLA